MTSNPIQNTFEAWKLLGELDAEAKSSNLVEDVRENLNAGRLMRVSAQFEAKLIAVLDVWDPALAIRWLTLSSHMHDIDLAVTAEFSRLIQQRDHLLKIATSVHDEELQADLQCAVADFEFKEGITQIDLKFRENEAVKEGHVLLEAAIQEAWRWRQVPLSVPDQLENLAELHRHSQQYPVFDWAFGDHAILKVLSAASSSLMRRIGNGLRTSGAMAGLLRAQRFSGPGTKAGF